MKDTFKMTIKKNIPSIGAAIICLAIALFILIIPVRQKETHTIDLSEYSSVNRICELATLKSFYHNVAMFNEEPGGVDKVFNDILAWPFGKYTKVGYKQYWIEYSGIVETGIDASGIQIIGPDAKGVVEVYVPDAQVINVYAEPDSLSEPLSEKGLFTTISGEEKTQAFSAAQSEMRRQAENDQVMLKKAKENAKLLLKQYIIQTGNRIGSTLSVKWIDNL